MRRKWGRLLAGALVAGLLAASMGSAVAAGGDNGADVVSDEWSFSICIDIAPTVRWCVNGAGQTRTVETPSGNLIYHETVYDESIFYIEGVLASHRIIEDNIRYLVKDGEGHGGSFRQTVETPLDGCVASYDVHYANGRLVRDNYQLVCTS